MSKLELSTLLTNIRAETQRREDEPEMHVNIETFDYSKMEGVVIDDFEKLEPDEQ